MGSSLTTSSTPITRAARVLDLLTLREARDSILIGTHASVAVIQVEPIKLFALLPEKKQEELLAGFRVLLTRLSMGAELSIHVRVRPWNLGPTFEHLAQTEAQAPTLAHAELTREHITLLDTLVSERILLEQTIFVRCAVPHPRRGGKHMPKRQHIQVHETLEQDVAVVLRDLDRCGVRAHRLTTDELIAYYRSCLHAQSATTSLPSSVLAAVDRPVRGIWGSPSPLASSTALTLYEEPVELEEFPPDSEPGASLQPKRHWLWRSRRAIEQDQKRAYRRRPREILSDMQSLPELLQPSLIEAHPHHVLIRMESDEFVRGRAIIGYPAVLVAGWFDRLLHLEEPFLDVLLVVETLNPRAYVRRLTHTITRLRGTQLLEARGGRTENPYVQAKRDEVELLRDALVRQEERVHGVSLYILARAANRRELKERDQRIVAALEDLELVSTELTYEHLHAWQCVLPDGRDVLKRRRVLDTSSLMTAFPFTSQSFSMERGICVGATPVSGLVLVDPASPLLDNGHELIFARSGAGKSYYQKMWLLRALQQGYEAIVIDPEHEYQPICDFLSGSTIRLAPGSFSLNPFDLPIVPSRHEERRIFAEKVESLLVLFDLLLAEKTTGVLSQKEKGYLTKIIGRVYEEQGITEDPVTHTRTPPTMQQVAQTMLADGDPYALVDRLQRHVSAFPEQTQVDLDNPLVVFSIRDLSPALKPVGLFLVTDFVWNRVRQETAPRPRFLMIDEAWVLMQFLEGGRFLADLSRRARKYHLHLKMVTQDVEDFLSSEAGRTILQNSAMKMLMKQDATAIETVAQALRLSEEERRFLMSCGKGEGLFFLGESHTPLSVLSSPLEHRLATTDPQERWYEAQQIVEANEADNHSH